jgi:hypothetical protein
VARSPFRQALIYPFIAARGLGRSPSSSHPKYRANPKPKVQANDDDHSSCHFNAARGVVRSPLSSPPKYRANPKPKVEADDNDYSSCRSPSPSQPKYRANPKPKVQANDDDHSSCHFNAARGVGPCPYRQASSELLVPKPRPSRRQRPLFPPRL